MKVLLAALLLLAAHSGLAASIINTHGSHPGVAISGFDTVAFFTENKAVPGKAEHSYDWMDAKWLFSSQQNLDLFKANPEKYAPQYGGHCAYGASEGYISQKPANGLFEVMKGKLYLFPDGRTSPNGAYNSWWQSRGGPQARIEAGDQYWPKLRARLESQAKER